MCVFFASRSSETHGLVAMQISMGRAHLCCPAMCGSKIGMAFVALDWQSIWGNFGDAVFEMSHEKV